MQHRMIMAKDDDVDYLDVLVKTVAVDEAVKDLGIDIDSDYQLIWYNEMGMPTVQTTRGVFYLIVEDRYGQTVQSRLLSGKYWDD